MLVTYKWPTSNSNNETATATLRCSSEEGLPSEGDFVELKFLPTGEEGWAPKEGWVKEGWVTQKSWKIRQGKESEIVIFLDDEKPTKYRP